jgi:hypothetical protein
MEFIIDKDIPSDTEAVSVVGCGLALESKKEISAFNWYTGQVIGNWKNPNPTKYFYFNDNMILLTGDGLVVVKKAVSYILFLLCYSHYLTIVVTIPRRKTINIKEIERKCFNIF